MVPADPNEDMVAVRLFLFDLKRWKGTPPG